MDENENRASGSSGAAITKFGNPVLKQQVSIEQKTTRMPKNELIDLLFNAFEMYAYWSLIGLKAYVKQPEPEYSRQTESIATVGLTSGNSGVDDDTALENNDDD